MEEREEDLGVFSLPVCLKPVRTFRASVNASLCADCIISFGIADFEQSHSQHECKRFRARECSVEFRVQYIFDV